MKISAPKRHTRSNLDPNPPFIVDDPEKIFRRLKSPISESAVWKIKRTTSLPKNLFTFEHLPFDIQLELSLWRSKSESCLPEVIFEPFQLDSHLHSFESLFSKVDHELWLNFDKLQSLADQFQITTEKDYIQY